MRIKQNAPFLNVEMAAPKHGETSTMEVLRDSRDNTKKVV